MTTSKTVQGNPSRDRERLSRFELPVERNGVKSTLPHFQTKKTSVIRQHLCSQQIFFARPVTHGISKPIQLHNFDEHRRSADDLNAISRCLHLVNKMVKSAKLVLNYELSGVPTRSRPPRPFGLDPVGPTP
jgi:hypothetical protein